MAAHYVWKWRVIDLGWVVVVISVVVVVAAAVACERERWGARTRVKTLRGCELCGKRGGATKSTALLKVKARSAALLRQKGLVPIEEKKRSRI
jgi:hypothetical protein